MWVTVDVCFCTEQYCKGPTVFCFQCAGVNFMEKTITLRNTEITFSIWDLGGQREFLSMLPLVSGVRFRGSFSCFLSIFFFVLIVFVLTAGSLPVKRR